MPITLGCPSCAKRFRARDESAGKRVKCPFCGAAVPVPSPDEPAGAPTVDLPADPPPAPPPPVRSSPLLEDSGPVATPAARPASPPPSRPSSPKPAPVASADDWGATPTPAAGPSAQPVPAPIPAAPPPPPPDMSPLGFAPAAPGRSSKPVGTPAKTPAAKSGQPAKSPDQLAAPGWARTRGGLFWVLFALFFLALPGFVGFGKTVYTRAVGELPKGDGIIIPGYVNSPEAGAIRMSKMEQIDIVAYGLPVIFAGLCLTLGRLACGAAPRSSGAKGLFFFSGVFTLAGFAGLVLAGAADKLVMKETYRYASVGFLILAAVAEFWFLMGLTTAAVALKRPKAARAVGLIGFVGGLIAAAATVGWTVYSQEARPKPLTDDWRMYEQGGVMLGWLLLMGVYWRAVGAVREAIADFLDTVPDF